MNQIFYQKLPLKILPKNPVTNSEPRSNYNKCFCWNTIVEMDREEIDQLNVMDIDQNNNVNKPLTLPRTVERSYQESPIGIIQRQSWSRIFLKVSEQNQKPNQDRNQSISMTTVKKRLSISICNTGMETSLNRQLYQDRIL